MEEENKKTRGRPRQKKNGITKFQEEQEKLVKIIEEYKKNNNGLMLRIVNLEAQLKKTSQNVPQPMATKNASISAHGMIFTLPDLLKQPLPFIESFIQNGTITL